MASAPQPAPARSPAPLAPSPVAGLRAALASAEAQPAAPANSSIANCPQPRRQAIEIVVLNEAAEPLASIAVRIAQGEQQVVDSITSVNGVARFEGLLPGQAVTITLPETDEDSWEFLDQAALAKPESSGDAPWAPPAPGPGEQVLEATPGHCIASLAYEHGWLAESLWSHPSNAVLQGERDSLYILKDGDTVCIPVPRLRQMPGTAGNRYRLRRKGVPEKLRIRFLSFCHDPRPNLPYLLTLTARSGRPLAAKQGVTDGEGFLTEAIPPDAWEGQILLGKERQEEIELFLGRVHPVKELSGLQRRLNNLGYLCGSEDGVLTAQTRQALLDFQRDWELPQTGEADDATKVKMEEVFLS